MLFTSYKIVVICKLQNNVNGVRPDRGDVKEDTSFEDTDTKSEVSESSPEKMISSPLSSSSITSPDIPVGFLLICIVWNVHFSFIISNLNKKLLQIISEFVTWSLSNLGYAEKKTEAEAEYHELVFKNIRVGG